MGSISVNARKVVGRFYPPSNLAFHFQRLFMKPATRKSIARILAGRLPQGSAAGHDPRIVTELETDGFSFVPGLISEAQIADIHAYLSGKPSSDAWRPESGAFHISRPPATCHTAPYSQEDIIACPHLLEIANHPLVLATMTRLFGCKPTISNVALWWSLAGHSKPEQAELFHRDVDEWQFIKLFVYLTDVDEGSGPHVFLKGSPAAAKLLQIRRYQDDEVNSAFGGENVMRFTGKAGTAFLENTFGLHKGTLPIARNRLLFQVQYSLFPIGIYRYHPKTPATPVAGFDPYINRLYIKAGNGSAAEGTSR